jgi:mRNA-degrading endonuclease toxin of MazEF toxin-antitoxin module
VPLSTSVHKGDLPTHLVLEPGQTGLRERVVAKAEDVSAVWKVELDPSKDRLRTLTSHQVCELARKVEIAMGCAAAGEGL